MENENEGYAKSWKIHGKIVENDGYTIVENMFYSRLDIFDSYNPNHCFFVVEIARLTI